MHHLARPVTVALAGLVAVAAALVSSVAPAGATVPATGVRAAAVAAVPAPTTTTLSTTRNPTYSAQAGGMTARVRGEKAASICASDGSKPCSTVVSTTTGTPPDTRTMSA